MKKIVTMIFILVILISIPNLAHAQSWSGIIPAGGAIDWTQTGIPGGIPATRTACGATINPPAGDATSVIQSALKSCGANQFVLLGPGTFTINSTVNVPANVTLRGSGANLTILNVHGSAQAPVTLGSGSVAYTAVNITSGATAGSTSIGVSSASGIAVGSYLVISEINNPSFVTNQGGEGACTWCDGWSTNGTRARGQIVEVKSVSGTTIGISPGLYSAYTQTPTAVPFAASEVYAGVEDLQVYMNNTGYTDAFYMSKCAYCWVKGTEVNYTDGDYVEIDWGYRDEIRDNYFSNAYLHTPGTTDADIFPVYKTSASKIENNIIERGHAALMPSRGAAGNVIAYNYVEGSFDAGSTNFDIGGVGMHGAHPQFNLIEGNVFPLFYPDQVWGSSSNNTTFRNWVVGTSRSCIPLSGRGTVNCTGTNGHYLYQAARAMQIAHLSTYYNLVGDVVGSSQMQGLGRTNTASVAYPAVRQYDTAVYGYTWGYGESNDDGGGNGCSGGTAPCNGTQAFSTAFLHGEYNNINSTTTWATGVTQTLPVSFYLSSKPAWWGTTPFPAIGPDVTGGPGPGGHTYLIPAQNCYLNVMGGSDGGPGSPLAFNASACYAAGSPPPAPPTALNVSGVQ